MKDIDSTDDMRTATSLRAIGFWTAPSPQLERPDLGPNDPYVRFLAERHEAEAHSGRPFLPDPRRLIGILGVHSYDGRVPAYLTQGARAAQYFGVAVCRCCGATLGSSDLTDGTWVWPEGLEHYLQAHGLPLPGPFVNTIEQNRYQVPLAARGLVDVGRFGQYDFDFWHEWAASVYGPDAP